MQTPLGSCARFVLLHHLHKVEQFRSTREKGETWASTQVGSISVTCAEAPFPGTGFPLLVPEDSMWSLVHLEGGTRDASAPFRAKVLKVSPMEAQQGVPCREDAGKTRWARPCTRLGFSWSSAPISLIGGILHSISVGRERWVLLKSLKFIVLVIRIYLLTRT